MEPTPPSSHAPLLSPRTARHSGHDTALSLSTLAFVSSTKKRAIRDAVDHHETALHASQSAHLSVSEQLAACQVELAALRAREDAVLAREGAALAAAEEMRAFGEKANRRSEACEAENATLEAECKYIYGLFPQLRPHKRWSQQRRELADRWRPGFSGQGGGCASPRSAQKRPARKMTLETPPMSNRPLTADSAGAQYVVSDRRFHTAGGAASTAARGGRPDVSSGAAGGGHKFWAVISHREVHTPAQTAGTQRFAHSPRFAGITPLQLQSKQHWAASASGSGASPRQLRSPRITGSKQWSPNVAAHMGSRTGSAHSTSSFNRAGLNAVATKER